MDMSDILDLKDQEKGKEKTEAKNRKKREKELGDIRKVLSIPEGRRLYWRFLSKCGVFRSSWTGDANQTLVNEGMRIPGLIFLDDLLEASPNTYAQLQREHKSSTTEEE
jgi:hypothetical protein